VFKPLLPLFAADALENMAVWGALDPFTDIDGRVVLPAWYRAVLAEG
jgi:hypothetical protein